MAKKCKNKSVARTKFLFCLLNLLFCGSSRFRLVVINYIFGTVTALFQGSHARLPCYETVVDLTLVVNMTQKRGRPITMLLGRISEMMKLYMLNLTKVSYLVTSGMLNPCKLLSPTLSVGPGEKARQKFSSKGERAPG